ncbi:hypothetical protein TNCV_1143091 [Trichonephila clavipes]|nr:hypothetical protein TNCV_1143091 [Trichonephila clavipes]
MLVATGGVGDKCLRDFDKNKSSAGSDPIISVASWALVCKICSHAERGGGVGVRLGESIKSISVGNISSELHNFVDAARGAYAACVFVRSIIDSKINIVLARAMSRVSPLKTLDTPHLELMACNIGARLVNSL